jgi:phosphatidylethanolamine-binding protein (PEBP) family uncharacterized protein
MAATSSRRARPGRALARLSRISAVGLVGVAGALGGCGGVAASSSSSRAQPLEIASPAVTKSGSLPAQYTCAGRDVSPPLKWGNVPTGTAELALFLLDLSRPKAAAGGATRAQVVVGWSVRGLSPTLEGMAAGKLAAGAVTGHKRYTICPPKGGTGEYMFRLYALPRRLAVKRGLSDLDLFKQVNRASSAVGYFLSLYRRP